MLQELSALAPSSYVALYSQFIRPDQVVEVHHMRSFSRCSGRGLMSTSSSPSLPSTYSPSVITHGTAGLLVHPTPRRPRRFSPKVPLL
jgi:hypothetical protein